jgi:hypothetical protein
LRRGAAASLCNSDWKPKYDPMPGSANHTSLLRFA